MRHKPGSLLRGAGRIATVLVVVWMVTSGLGALLGLEEIATAIAHLGYPPHVRTLLGLAKLLEASALALPVPAPVRSWAYAGAVFELLAALWSYAAVDGVSFDLVPPTVFLALVVVSGVWRAPRSAPLSA